MSFLQMAYCSPAIKTKRTMTSLPRKNPSLIKGDPKSLAGPYSPLTGPRTIRLLRLNQNLPEDCIEGSLTNVDLDDAATYEAISYAWGDPSETADITVDGWPLSIPQSLKKALLRLRGFSERLIWADAICINQQSLVEKNHQVSFMAEIFHGATRVCVWLGDSDGNETAAVEFSKRILSKEASHLDQVTVHPNELSPAEVWHWRAVVKMLNKPWFRRCWTLQEIGVSRQATVFYGVQEIPFEHIDMLIGWIEVHGRLLRSYFDIKLEPRYRFCVLFYKQFSPDYMRRTGIHGVQIADFIAVLKYTRNFGVTDPKDRIYAFLGLRPLLADTNLEMEVDYHKTAAEVYTAFALNYVKQPSGLRILSNIHESEAREDLGLAPSWVPMWDKPKPTWELGSKLLYYHAGGFEDPPYIYIHSQNILVIEGAIIDTVAMAYNNFVAADFEPAARSRIVPSFHPLEHLWLQVQKVFLDIEGESRYECQHEAFSLTLVAGLFGNFDSPAEEHLCQHMINFYSYLSEVATHSDAYTEWLNITGHQNRASELLEAGRGGDWASYEAHLQQASSDRKFFVTRGGYVGIGPMGLQEGDLCVVVHGATVPFCLRQESEGCRLIGECYILGFMRGEAVRMCTSGQLQARTLYII